MEGRSSPKVSGSEIAASISLPKPLLGRASDLVVAAILTMVLAASLFLLPRLGFDSSLESKLSDQSGLAELQAAESIFPPEHLALLALPCESTYSESSLARLQTLGQRIEEWSAKRNCGWKLYSPTTVTTFENEAGELTSVTIVGTSRSGDLAERRLQDSPLLSRLFLSRDGKAWILYLDIAKIDGELDRMLRSLRVEFPELKVSGPVWAMARTKAVFGREFGLLLGLAALVLLLIQCFLYRSAVVGLLLWAFSLLPTLALLGVIVLLGKPLRIAFVLAPVMTLALSTSYITHLFRSWLYCDCDPRAALRDRAGIILLDAGTTLFGFSSMLVSPIADLVFLGWLAILGVVLSLLFILFGLPSVLGLARRAPSVSQRVLEPSRARGPGKRGIGRIAAWATLALVLGALSLRIGLGYRSSDLFSPWTREGQDLAWFDEHLPGSSEAGLVVSSGRPEGIVDMAFWEGLERTEAALRQQPGVAFVYGPSEIVGELLARYEGRGGIAEPKSEKDIGEALELLSESGGGLFSRGFVSSAWSDALIHVSFTPGFDGIRDFPTLSREGLRLGTEYLPAAKLAWSGDVARHAIVERAFIAGQISGSFLFFGLLLVGLVVVFRSVPKALAISIVPLTGFLAALGCMGLLGWNLNAENAVALAVIAGTGVDSAIVVVRRGWSGEARDAAADTTLLVVGAVLVLLLSSFFLIVQTAVICAVGLVASTLSTIYVLPGFTILAPRTRIES